MCRHICMHTFIHLRPDMKITKIKASDLYEKNIYTCNFSSSERRERGNLFCVIILPKSHLNLPTFIHIHY